MDGDVKCPWRRHKTSGQVFRDLHNANLDEAGTEQHSWTLMSRNVQVSGNGNILINHPRGMFLLNLGLPHDVVKQTLIDQGVVLADGLVIVERPVPFIVNWTFLDTRVMSSHGTAMGGFCEV